jgi:DNA-binding transcriptional MerR regulator
MKKPGPSRFFFACWRRRGQASKALDFERTRTYRIDRMESHLSIDEVARRTGLSPHTLRYYERIGLIAPVARAPGGQRRYAASDLAWIEFLLRLRTTHMTISQMQSFARLRGAGEATVPARRQMLEAHLAQVLAEIDAMRRSAVALQDKIAHYRSLEQSLAPTSTFDEGSDNEQPREHTGSLRAGPGQTARNRR